MHRLHRLSAATTVVVSLYSGILNQARADAPQGDAPTRILFAGSSSTYFNDMPRQLAELLTREANMPTKAILAGRSGSGIHVYLQPGFDRYEYGVPKGKTFLDVVEEGKFDFVVLMAVARFITGEEGEEHSRALDTYIEKARQAGSEPVIYEMGWGRAEQEQRGRELILEAAVRNGVEFYVPCSTAWARVYEERPDIELQDPPDTAHPGGLGCYLNLCCFYRVLSGKSPTGLPATVLDWEPMTDAEKEQVATQRRNHPPTDPYVLALPGWMQTRSLGAVTRQIDPELAAYLQGVANEVCGGFSAKLKANH